MAKALHNAEQTAHANLLELAPIVQGAIVSKPLIDNGTLRQIVFSMDKGQLMSEHRAPFVAVVQILDGELDFTVDGETRRLVAHDWLVMPPDKPHDLGAVEPTRFLLTMVKEPKA